MKMSGTLGPFRAEQLRSGDPYELSNGYLIPCPPTGGRRAKAISVGDGVLASDRQRQGYASLDEVRAEGEIQGLREAVLEVLAARGFAVEDDLRTALSSSGDPAA